MEKYFDINNGEYSVRSKIFYTDIKRIDKVVIYLHGFGSYKDTTSCKLFSERLITKYKGFAVVCFDLPAHGEDALKNINLKKCNDYLSILINHLNANYKNPKIYLYGTSFGGYLILKYLYENKFSFEKIALRAPALNIYESMLNTIMTKDDVDKVNKGKEVLVGFDRKVRINKEFLNDLKINDVRNYDYIDYAEQMIIIHGTKDEVIPYQESENFSNNNVIELIPIENGNHRLSDPKKMDIAIQKIINFFA